MTHFAITTATHPRTMEATISAFPSGRSVLQIGETLNSVNLHVPTHVAEATAEAFNRAMQAEQQADGSLKYQPEGHCAWFISLDLAMGKVWQFQSDEVTGDDDPHWMTGIASSALEAMAVIDDLIEEHACPECKAMVGERKLNDCTDGNVRCWDCDEAWQEREASLAEMAADDKAHAARDMARGL